MATIRRINSVEAYDLLFPEHLSTLSTIDCETMHRAIMNSSRVWLGEDGDQIIAVWGLIPPTLLSDIAYLWLYTTKHMNSHVFVFVRHSQRAVQEMLNDYPTIVGHAAVGATQSIQWLRWLGAEFGEPINDKAIPFTIKASQQWPQVSAQSA